MFFKKSFTVFVCAAVLITCLGAQTSFTQNPVFQSNQEITFNGAALFAGDGSSSDSFFNQKSWSERKHPFVALSGALGFNLLLATYNRYVIGSGWAQTGWDEWNHFWERELTWDRDWYWTNFFLHPYQGSMYYMNSRGANLNALEAMAVTVLGSYTWEYLCECNAPSKNDMVYTTIGSFCVGEMFFRLSQEANEMSRLLGVAINPDRLWTEYVWRIKQKNTSGRLHTFTLGLEMGNCVAGTKVENASRYANDYHSPEVYPVFGGLQLYIDYRDPYSHDSNTPYDQFTLQIHGNMGKGSGYEGLCAYESIDKKMFYDIRIFSDAMLIARTLNAGSDIDTTYGLTMIYDFDWHSYYMLSSLAPGLAFKQRVNMENSKFEWQAQAAFVLLGNSDYFYYHRKVDNIPDGTIRSYSHTTGAQTILKFKYTTDSDLALGLNFRGYAMYDFYDQLQTDNETTGWEYIGLLNANIDIPVSKKVRIGVSDEVYGKIGDYRKQENVYQLINTAKVCAKLKLK